jgi:membrane protease YdiL (CAAX protease family)
LRGTAFEILILLLAGWILYVRGWRFRTLAGGFSWSSVLAGIPLFVAYMLLYWFTALTVASFFPGVAKIRPFQITHTASPVVILTFFLVNSVFEEFSVTAYVVTALRTEGQALAITASVLIRFLYHVYQGPLASLSILPLGILFGMVYWRYRNVWPLVIAHTVANLLAYAASEFRAT